MSRLTEISQLPAGKTCYQPITKDDTNHEWHTQNNECLTKLGKLEDLEDEIGMSLLELFKAFTNGYHFINGQKIRSVENVHTKMGFSGKYFYVYEYNPNGVLMSVCKLKDYNKTWFTDKAKAEEKLKESK